MKKKIMITLIAFISISVAAYSIAEENDNPASSCWGYDITWDDSGCSCGTIIKAELAWAVWQWYDNQWNLVDHGTENVINYTTNIYSVVSCVGLSECEDCCKICAKVTYWDSNGICCYDDDCEEDISSYSLYYGDEVVALTMN
jgi:hypothetical protein